MSWNNLPSSSEQPDSSDEPRYTQFRCVMMENRFINDLTRQLKTTDYRCFVDVIPDVISGILDIVLQSDSEEELEACDQRTVSEVISFCERNRQRVFWIGPAEKMTAAA